MPELLYNCMTKGTVAEGDQRKNGPNWVTARRASLKIFDDHLECGNWHVNFPEIERAVLYSFRSSLLLPGYILSVETNDRAYSFGLNGWGKFWKGELPFAVEREKGRLKLSWFSIAVRAMLIGCIGYLLWLWAVPK